MDRRRVITESDALDWFKHNPNTRVVNAPIWVQEYCIACAEEELIRDGMMEGTLQ